MQTIEKIFVDQDDEIIFVVEKILRAATSRVILVIPATSGVVSSVISLKLLSKQLIDSNKLLILVTDNPTGIKLAGKANLVVRDKISLVDKSAWDEALAIKNELREHKEGIKKELLTSRIPEKVIEEEVESEPEVIEAVEPEVTEEPEIVKPVEHTEKEIFGEKPRLNPKIITVGGIAIASGGDINELKDLSMPASEIELAKDEFTEISEKPEKSVEPEKQEVEQESSKVATRRLKETGPKKKRKIKKILLILVIGLLLLLLLAGGAFAYSYKNMAKVEIDVEFNQSEGNINETITVSTLATEIDSENLVIPGTELGLEESSSGDGVATGKKETGTNAQGVIDIRNKSTESAVNLAAGQVFIDISTNLQYVLTQNTTIAVDQYQRDVPIKAKEFGDNYNIEDQQSTFRVEGFTTDQLIGFGFRDITGGKTEEITVVTAEDVAKVKQSLETAIKGNLATNLKSQISQGEILLEGSQRYEEVSLEQTVQNDEEAENFSVDLKMKVIAIKVNEEDIKSMAQGIIKKSEKATDQAEIKVDDFEVKNVKVEGSKITFELVAKGEVNENLQLEEQKDQITGKTIDEAKAYLEELEQIDKVNITYKPDYIPENIRKIPSKRENIIFK
ncbi:hypothetical protein KC675_02010 [Candidatus Dojkabacteria bacterium]|uniref:Baseplate protein J-like domain-containing protein n=1 Tax=Candidatus Dojkabacteria bacterium TaxID=2099670 RepID=A0A955IDW5_9BACT|nr:hypothetical protein [Candidatus Dojkabacteria bacterium]